MKALLWNILLAAVWVAATGNFEPSNFLFGLALGLLVLIFSQPVFGTPGYLLKIRSLISLVAFFLKELVLANFRVAYEVFTPGYQFRPGVIAVPLDARTDIEITLLADLITITPGSVSLDVAEDRSVLYVHVMDIDDVEAVRRRIKDGFERRVLELLR